MVAIIRAFGIAHLLTLGAALSTSATSADLTAAQTENTSPSLGPYTTTARSDPTSENPASTANGYHTGSISTAVVVTTIRPEPPVVRTEISDTSLDVPHHTLTTVTWVGFQVHLEPSQHSLMVPTAYPGYGQPGPGLGGASQPPPSAYPYPDSPPPYTIGSQPGAGSGQAPYNGPGDAVPVSVGEAIVVTSVVSDGSVPSPVVTTVAGGLTTVGGQVFTAAPAVYTLTLVPVAQDGKGQGGGGGVTASSSSKADMSPPSSGIAGNTAVNKSLASSGSAGMTTAGSATSTAAKSTTISRPSNEPTSQGNDASRWNVVSGPAVMFVAVGALAFM